MINKYNPKYFLKNNFFNFSDDKINLHRNYRFEINVKGTVCVISSEPLGKDGKMPDLQPYL